MPDINPKALFKTLSKVLFWLITCLTLSILSLVLILEDNPLFTITNTLLVALAKFLLIFACFMCVFLACFQFAGMRRWPFAIGLQLVTLISTIYVVRIRELDSVAYILYQMATNPWDSGNRVEDCTVDVFQKLDNCRIDDQSMMQGVFFKLNAQGIPKKEDCQNFATIPSKLPYLVMTHQDKKCPMTDLKVWNQAKCPEGIPSDGWSCFHCFYKSASHDIYDYTFGFSKDCSKAHYQHLGNDREIRKNLYLREAASNGFNVYFPVIDVDDMERQDPQLMAKNKIQALRTYFSQNQERWFMDEQGRLWVSSELFQDEETIMNTIEKGSSVLASIDVQSGESHGDTRNSDAETFHLKRADVNAALGRGFSKILEQGRLVPYHANNDMVGFKLIGVKSDSLWAQIKLKSGAILLSINGTHLNRPELGFRFYEGLESEQVLNIKVLTQEKSLKSLQLIIE